MSSYQGLGRMSSYFNQRLHQSQLLKSLLGRQEGSLIQAASLAHPLENLFREILFPAKKIQEF